MDVEVTPHAVARFQQRIAALPTTAARQAIVDGCDRPRSVSGDTDPQTGRARWTLRARVVQDGIRCAFLAVVIAAAQPDDLPAVVTVKHATRGYSRGAGRPRRLVSPWA